MICLLNSPQDKETRRKARAVEQLITQSDNSLYQIRFDEFLSNALFVIPEENTLGHHYRHTAVTPTHRTYHVLDPSKVSARIRGCSPNVTTVFVIRPLSSTPFLQGEWWIRDYTIEGRQLASGQDLWVTQGISLHDVEIRCTVQKQIHLSNGCIDHILFLTENATTAQVVVMHMMDGLYEHTSGSASRVIDGFSWLWIKDAYKQLNYRARSIEFAGLCLTVICEAFEKDLISIAHQVCRIIFVTETPGR